MSDVEAETPPWSEGEVIKMPPPYEARATTNWRSTPQREFLRCVACALYQDRGLRGKTLASTFRELVPDYATHMGGELTDNAISAKAYNSWFYEDENPERDPKVTPYYELARRVVNRGRQVEVEEVLRHIGTMAPAETVEDATGEV